MISYLVALALTQVGTPGKMEIPLHFEPFDHVQQYGMPPIARQWTHAKDIPAFVKEYQAPSFTGVPIAGHIQIAGKPYALFCISQKEGVWIDWNGDKKFADDEMALPLPDRAMYPSSPGSAQSQIYVYRPTQYPDNAPKVMIQITGSTPSVIPGGRLVGTLPIGKGLKIGLIDSNLNGDYGDTFLQSDVRNPGDMICIDWNGNGKFDDPAPNSMKLRDYEELPLGELIQLDGGFFEFEMSKDQKTLSVLPYAGPKGTLKVIGGKPLLLGLVGKRSIVYAEFSGTTLEVPGGSYSIEMVASTVTDAKGKTWTLMSANSSKGNRKHLAADKETIVKVGIPLKVILKANESTTGVQFSLDVSDPDGRSVSSLSDAKGGRPAAPTLKITDAKGKVVKALTFSYG